jgi:hypothetical protein
MPYLRIFWVWGFQDVTKQQFRVLVHDSAGERIALIGTQIMSVSPTTTNKLLKISAGIELFVVG